MSEQISYSPHTRVAGHSRLSEAHQSTAQSLSELPIILWTGIFSQAARAENHPTPHACL